MTDVQLNWWYIAILGTIKLWANKWLILTRIIRVIQVRRTRHAGHSWRSRDELISDVLLWIPTHGRAKAGRPARTYIQQLCEDTGCCPEDLPRAMKDREEWRERVRDIRATSAIWWWWWNSNHWKDLTVEKIAILAWKQISSNSFKNDITDKSLTYHVYLSQYVRANEMLNCFC